MIFWENSFRRCLNYNIEKHTCSVIYMNTHQIRFPSFPVISDKVTNFQNTLDKMDERHILKTVDPR